MAADPWGHPHDYSGTADGAGYRLRSFGADGKAGGEGQDADIAPWAGLSLAELLVVPALRRWRRGWWRAARATPPALQDEALRAFLRAARADAMQADRVVVLTSEGGVLRSGGRAFDLGAAPVLAGPPVFRPDGTGAGALRGVGFFLPIDPVMGALDAG